jgi:hypothetical protein
VVWSQFVDTNTRLGAEANELFDVLRMSRSLPEELRAPMAGLLRKYVDRVLESEWHSIRKADRGSSSEGWAILDRVWDTVAKAELSDDRARFIAGEVMSRFNQLADARTARISSASTKIPLPLRILLYSGGLTLVVSLFLFQVRELWIHVFIVAATAGAISHVLFVIEDLDDPFRGAWQVTDAPFMRVCDYLDDC